MARELRFTDPAFRCEVVLSGTAMALYEAAQPQFERLKGIKSLGLTAHVNDVAMHTRHQHLVGLMRIFGKLCQQPKDKGLPKSFLWSFWCRLCFAQTGHAALSYDAEKAVLLACHLDSNLKAKFRALVQPVIDKLGPCSKCTRMTCRVRDKGSADASHWFDEMIARNRWQQLYLWIAALKLLQEAKLLPILSGQGDGAGNTLGFSEPEAIKMLVAPGCEWDQSVRNLSRLDFIVRDLAFAGTLGIQLDVDNLVAAANAPHPDWQLLNSLSTYMSDTLYESVPAQTASVLLQRALASLLINGTVTLEALFGIDLTTALSDDALKTVIGRKPAGREVLDATTRNAWRAWPINTYIDPQRMPCELEKGITGHNQSHLTRHTASRATCLKLRQPHTLALAIRHQSLADRPEAKAFVKLCRSVLNHQYPKLVPEQLTSALFDGLVDRHCEHGLENAVEKLSKLAIGLPALRKAADVVNVRASGKSAVAGDVSFKIGGYEYPFRGDPQEMQINTMHAALSGSDQVRTNLGMSVPDAAEILWDELTGWQSIYFGMKPTKKVSDAVKEAQDILAKQVVAAGVGAETDLELYALLEALKHPGESVSFRIALPNLKLMKEDGTIENEYDVVSVALKGDKDVEVWVWGVTTSADLGPKRAADLEKIQKLKDLLGGRWEADVRIVTCYVHRDGNDICLEIDGVQSKRTVPAP
ncbi:MAG TPA: hypothetical protein VKS43_01075 [Burkholderiales bacterium]|nr:hypothetical protein [Burkholderiales bacterium]